MLNIIKPVYAAPIQNQALGSLATKSSGEGVAFYIGRLWITITIVGGLAFIIYLVWGGLSIMLASGDKNKLEEGQGRIKNALIGLTILALSYAIILFIEKILQINLLSPEFPT